MKLAQSSHNKLEAFFREFLSDENFRLPVINFYSGIFSQVLTFVLRVHGITFGNQIFIMPELIATDVENRRCLPLELAAHEVVHVLQYKKQGFVGFFYRYLSDYWKNLRPKENWSFQSRHEAYLEIPFEIEAREIAARFVDSQRRNKTTR